MEQDILDKLNDQGLKIEKIALDIEKMRNYFFWTFIITIAVIVLPLLGLVLVIPSFLNTITGTGLGL